MTHKLIIMAALAWLACVVGGAVCGRLEGRAQHSVRSRDQQELAKLQDLYAARLFDETCRECELAAHDPNCGPIRCQVMYIRWAALRQLGQGDAAGERGREFIQTYPESALAADVHFAAATDGMRRSDFVEAERELDVVVRNYPLAPVQKQAGAMLENLRRMRTQVVANP